MPYKNIVITPLKKPNLDTAKESQFYKGFSTVSNLENSKIFDAELVKQDLLNTFNTRKGERVMNPEFGTIIWDLIYEPLTENLKYELEADIREILTSDSRVSVIGVQVAEKEFGILLEITMRYAESNQTETLQLQFDKEIGLITR